MAKKSKKTNRIRYGMDNLKIDLNITNHLPHPDRPGYMVIHYSTKEKADHFEEQLKIKGYFYEKGEETQGEGENEIITRYLFGVRVTEFEEINILNYTTIGTFRKRSIPDKGARMVITVIGVLLVLFAFAGYLHSKGVF